MLRKLLLVFLFVVIACAGFAAEKISVRADVWMPYNGQPDSEKLGYGIDILKAIFEPKGFEIDYQTMPWNRAVEDTREGKFDCVVGAGVRDAAGFVFPTEKLGYSVNNLFVKSDSNVAFTGIESLKTLKIGIIADYSYSEELDKYIAECKSDEQKFFVVNGEDALEKMAKMVIAGRLDGFVENPLVVAQEAWKGDVKSAGQIGEKDALYIAFSPARDSSKKHVEILDAGIKELRASGKLTEILAKYGLTDWGE